ncbi:MAG TPA: hypothetical protein VGO40_13905, partial [Longimicrobium sp.]|nr:hypothetical protein [Longimicrobium sp.]
MTTPSSPTARRLRLLAAACVLFAPAALRAQAQPHAHPRPAAGDSVAVAAAVHGYHAALAAGDSAAALAL